jgi:hypothetical protein
MPMRVVFSMPERIPPPFISVAIAIGIEWLPAAGVGEKGVRG